MPVLHKFSLEKDYKKLKGFLAQFVPTTTMLLGWLLGTGFYDSDPKGKCSIWTSDPDPFECKDPVVWIFDSKHRTRIFVTSEVVLDLGTFTEEARELAGGAVYKGKILPNYFMEPQLEMLYNQSKEILESAMKAYTEMHEGEVLIHGVNLIWSPVFHKLLDIQFDAPCFKFVKPLSSIDLDKEMDLPHDLKMTKLEYKDIQQVHSSNKVVYDIKYIEDCFRLSSAIRRVDNDELAAWSMTHRDFCVGALHVLPDHRRKGYAEIILHDVCKQYIDFYKQAIPESVADLYFSATVEHYNASSANLFKKTGWTNFGLGVTWILCSRVVS